VGGAVFLFCSSSMQKDPELEKAFLGMMEAFGRRLTSVPPLWRYGIQFGQIKQDQKMFQRLVEFALDSTKLALQVIRARLKSSFLTPVFVLQDPEISKQNSLIARVLEGEEAGKLSTNELTSQMILLQNAG
jgi:hypothetical protein